MQDGSGKTSAFLGRGAVVAAPNVPRPDKIGMMMQMAKMDMRMGAPAIKFNPGEVHPQQMMENWGMKMSNMLTALGRVVTFPCGFNGN